jgi:hypothetical protein
MHRLVEVKLNVYVPDELSHDEDAVVDYLNEKLENYPEFFGEIDTACVKITDEISDFDF